MLSLLYGLVTIFSVAFAQDAISLSAVRVVGVGQSPSLTFESSVDGRLEATLTCGAKRFSLSEAITPGGRYTLEMSGLSAGSHRCGGQVTLSAADGTQGQMPLSLEVAVRPPPALRVADADLNLQARTLVLQADRPLGDVQVDVWGPDNVRIGGVRAPGDGRTTLPVEWASEGEIVKIDVTASDSDGIAARLELLPWSYNIPHEDVVFEPNSDVIRPEEVPKLQAAWAELTTVQARYGAVVEVALYVVGCTDTVGSTTSNLDLSDRRARAIASWFKTRGFTGKIAYQGLGESLLAVPTGDETPEARNRRAIYLLAARPPGASAGIPKAAWKTL